MSIEQRTHEAIKDLRALYQINPFRYLYESDIQAELYARLNEKESLEITIKTNADFRKRFANLGEIKTTVWKSEYPSGIRYDLAAIEHRANKGDRLPWNQPVSIAIELKYLQCGEREDVFRGKYIADLKKLQQGLEKKIITRSGMAILFIQNQINVLKLFPDYENLGEVPEPTDGVISIIVTPSEIYASKYL